MITVEIDLTVLHWHTCSSSNSLSMSLLTGLHVLKSIHESELSRPSLHVQKRPAKQLMALAALRCMSSKMSGSAGGAQVGQPLWLSVLSSQ